MYLMRDSTDASLSFICFFLAVNGWLFRGQKSEYVAY